MQPNLDNLKKKIQENRDLIDRITVKLPGFKGYVEKAESYAADKIVRDLLADRILGFKNEVNAKMVELEKKQRRDSLGDLDSLSLKMEAMIKKCQHADFGRAAALSSMTISEDDKNRLLEYDWRLISALDGIEKSLGELRNASDAIGTVISGIGDALRAFEKNFDERKNVLLEVI
ncbi:MAG TPA: hypothetical protein PLM53_02340 [Spirochaetota bacterium]|nr:hypothetical protein [Spirochaetota bacterium]HPC43233.1 hypothetical protein [Spirochaetota bacterium]HPL16527.1 hypothetical protein [Spirochaetota bacterium]HQF06686.1 hypothetical protein [Spirochaetota bacterium]HQH95911.1 hypothetical protein [Spirochaetota bacterium]